MRQTIMKHSLEQAATVSPHLLSEILLLGNLGEKCLMKVARREGLQVGRESLQLGCGGGGLVPGGSTRTGGGEDQD